MSFFTYSSIQATLRQKHQATTVCLLSMRKTKAPIPFFSPWTTTSLKEVRSQSYRYYPLLTQKNPHGFKKRLLGYDESILIQRQKIFPLFDVRCHKHPRANTMFSLCLTGLRGQIDKYPYETKQILTSKSEIDFDTICNSLLLTVQILSVLDPNEPSRL